MRYTLRREGVALVLPNIAKLFVCLLFLSATQLTYAQENGKKLIEDHVKRMNTFGFPSGNQVYYMHSTTTLEPNTTKMQANIPVSPKNVEVKIMVSKNFTAYKSTYIEVYQDNEESYTVIHPQKTIICAKKKTSNQLKEKNGFAQDFGKVQEDLLLHTTLTNEKVGTWQGKSVKIIELQTTVVGKEKYNIEKLTYYYDLASKQVVKQWIDYAPDYKLKRQIATYHELDLDYKGKIKKSAKSSIYTAKNQLHKSYQGYKLEYQN